MRKVNQITWDLVKKEFDFSKVEKGETLNILKGGYLGITKDGFWYESEPRFFKVKAR